MSTITKEWLQKAINDYESVRDDLPFGLDDYQGNILAALRIALASLEAEPYGYVNKSAYEQAGSCGLSSDHEAYRDSSTHIAVYTAPPAPVSVPDEATPENIEILASTYAPCGVTYQWDSDECNAAADSWNACLAAMLQGAEPVTTTYKLPPHVYRELVNSLRDTAVKYQGCQQLRGQISETLSQVIAHTPHCGNSQVIPDDARRMDWLVSKTVDVREPMVYGSHSLFWSQTITDEDDDYHATKLREQIDAAMAAEQAAAPQQEVKP
ncbi:TPA: hypothetical protein ACGSTA_001185 [Enterobacter cloacae]